MQGRALLCFLELSHAALALSGAPKQLAGLRAVGLPACTLGDERRERRGLGPAWVWGPGEGSIVSAACTSGARSIVAN
jgi:hypothetical protein